MTRMAVRCVARSLLTLLKLYVERGVAESASFAMQTIRLRALHASLSDSLVCNVRVHLVSITSHVTPHLCFSLACHRLTPLQLPLNRILRIYQVLLQFMTSIAEFGLISFTLPDLPTLDLRDGIRKVTRDALNDRERYPR